MTGRLGGRSLPFLRARPPPEPSDARQRLRQLCTVVDAGRPGLVCQSSPWTHGRQGLAASRTANLPVDWPLTVTSRHCQGRRVRQLNMSAGAGAEACLDVNFLALSGNLQYHCIGTASGLSLGGQKMMGSTRDLLEDLGSSALDTYLFDLDSPRGSGGDREVTTPSQKPEGRAGVSDAGRGGCGPACGGA